MQKTEFIRQINELVPRPDLSPPRHWYRFDRECAERRTSICSLPCGWWREFQRGNPPGASKIIQHQNAALPSELPAAAVHLQAGRTPQRVRLRPGRPAYGLLLARRPEGAWPIATHHCGVRAGAAVLHHGLWAVQSAACSKGPSHTAGKQAYPPRRPWPASPWINRSLPKSPAGPTISWTAWAQSSPRRCSSSRRPALPWLPISPAMQTWASQR